jgi:hypothetical protein
MLNLGYYSLYISKHLDILLRLQLSKFILPVVHGFIEIHNCSINKKSFDFILISRRSCYRAGIVWFIHILTPRVFADISISSPCPGTDLASSARRGAGFPWGGAWGSLTADSPLQSATLLSQHYLYLRWPNLHVCRCVAFYIIFCL